jgi:hypothetical protein
VGGAHAAAGLIVIRFSGALTPTPFIAVSIVAGALAMWGVYFDTAWHRTVGRDTFFSLPHLFIYGAGLLVWMSCVGAIVLATRGRLVDLGGIVLRAGPLRLPLGFAITGLGTAVIVLAVPTDLTWHAVFGKDLLIWSPPHLQGVLGGAIAGLGGLFTVAAQKGRGIVAPAWRWRLVMLLPLVDLLHYVHWSLAHYTLFPWTRTPDFYPFIVALTVPLVVVAGARAVGPWAPTWAGLLFFAAIVAIDGGLALVGFMRPAVTPVFAAPAAVVSLLYARRQECRHMPGLAVAAGAVYVLGFVVMEAAWMAWVIGIPWPVSRVLAALPITLATGAVMGWVGWVVGGFLVASGDPGGVPAVFGSSRRARWQARVAVLLVALGLASTYRPQVFGPPVTVAELRLEGAQAFPTQEALFWDALIDDAWPNGPVIDLVSEGTMDGIPFPIGPAWCAGDPSQLDRELPFVRFALTVNGAPVDLARYPMLRQRVPDGRVCAWVGVVSQGQRASQNRFVYTITLPSTRSLRVEATVVFKDP